MPPNPQGISRRRFDIALAGSLIGGFGGRSSGAARSPAPSAPDHVQALASGSRVKSTTAYRQLGFIDVDAHGGVPISPHLFGANNSWYWVPATRFNSFCRSLTRKAGITLLRFPGGFESEHYNWGSNSLNPKYKHYTRVAGASPAQAIDDMGAGNVSFVAPTLDAFFANSSAARRHWADVAGGLVQRYGGEVRDWEIGNEWYHFGGAPKHYNAYLKRYCELVSRYVPAMNSAAAQAGHRINLYVSVNWVRPHDLVLMQKWIPPHIWKQFDGLNLHIYTGFRPGGKSPYPPRPIGQVQDTIHELRKLSGKHLLYVSEWMAALNDNGHHGGLINAHYMLEIAGQFAAAGVELAAYWPAVCPQFFKDGRRAAQSGRVTLVTDLPGFPIDADGQAMKWMSESFRGHALRARISGTSATAISARMPDGTITVIIMSGPDSPNQAIRVRAVGKAWNKVTSAQVMWAGQGRMDRGAANISPLPTRVVRSRGTNEVELTVNPAGVNRGASWEIARLVLSQI